jgi:erythronate-4-phosphate dehydrogenase
MIYEAACRHFGIPATWQPNLPAVPAIRAEGDLRQIVRQVYDIAADDVALRASVRGFDKLRAEYPIRREFFNVELRGVDDQFQCTLRALGFRL